MSGVFGLTRSIFSHPMFDKKRVYSRLEAWVWILSETSWRDREKRVGGKTVKVKRGQMVASIRFMADAWDWHRSKVDRFVHELKTEQMIETALVEGQTLITVCNYDDYQKVALPKETDIETHSETAPRQHRDSTETNYKEGKEIKESNISLTGRSPSETIEAKVYRVGKEVLGKSAGGVITKLRKECEYDDEYVLHWLNEAKDKNNPMEWINAVIRSAQIREWRGVDGGPKQEVPFETKAEREFEENWERDWAGVDIW